MISPLQSNGDLGLDLDLEGDFKINSKFLNPSMTLTLTVNAGRFFRRKNFENQGFGQIPCHHEIAQQNPTISQLLCLLLFSNEHFLR